MSVNTVFFVLQFHVILVHHLHVRHFHARHLQSTLIPVMHLFDKYLHFFFFFSDNAHSSEFHSVRLFRHGHSNLQ